MSLQRTAQSVFIPPPVKGMTTENAYIDPRQGWARLLRNLQVKIGSVRKRGDQRISTSLTIPSSEKLIWFDRINDEYLWSDGVIRDRSNSTVYTGTIVGYPCFEGKFRDQVFLSFPGTATIQRDAGTWKAFNYTLATLTSSEIAGSVTYGGRAYFWGVDATDNSNQIEYGGLNSISGATTAYEITAYSDGGTVLFCRSVTLQAGDTTQDRFVVYLDNGVVLVFSGLNPGDSSWALTGRFKMTPPLGKHAFVDIEGDVIVMGEDYVYSTQAMFGGAAQASASNALTLPIQTLYRQAARDAVGLDTEAYPFVYYSPIYNALIFCLRWADDVMWSDETDVGTTSSAPYRRVQFVYFRDTGGWALWDIPQWRWPVKPKTATDNTPYWVIGGSEMSLNWNGTEYGIERVIEYDDVDLTGIEDFTATNGEKYKYQGTECVWSTTPFTQKPIQNSKIVGIMPFIQQDDGFRITSAGIVGQATDIFFQGEFGKFRQDGNSSFPLYRSLTEYTGTGSLPESIDAPFLSCGMQRQFMHAFVREGEMTDWEDNSVRWTEFFGMNVFYEPGGVL